MRTILFVMLIALTSIHGRGSLADFTPIVGWDQQLFPSYIFATAAIKNSGQQIDEMTLGDSNGLLGVQVEATEDNIPVEVTVECDGYMEASHYSGTLGKQGEIYSVFPKIRYRFDALGQCAQATPATVTFRVRLGTGQPEEKSTTVILRPINDCPIIVSHGEDFIDTSFTFATFVNEQHPFTDKLLREALDIGVVDSFTGYQSESDDEVLRQVYSVWDLMVARDVRYSSITTTAADSNQVFSQHVRLLEDSVNNQQANCVDGSVLLVSLLRKIGIESFLVLVPGHCYVGFYLDGEKERLLGLETTLIGAELDWPEDVEESLEEAIDESLQSEWSWPSFVSAIRVGTSNLIENTDKFSSSEDRDYQIIDVAAARKLGVLPIPFRSKEVFVSFDHSDYIDSAYDWDEDEDYDDEEDDEEDDEYDDEDEEDDDE
ncbi:MAG: hypothetical protein KDB03_09710 [Planctomycetales bacterium]|nr:hypothetical protein [Planctomycetales bacterium]